MNLTTELIMIVTLTPYLIVVGSLLIEVVKVEISFEKEEVINITDYTIR